MHERRTAGMKNGTEILRALADVVDRSAIYTEAQGTIEVEKLYLLPHGLQDFVTKVSGSLFQARDEVEQSDAFYDIKLGNRWQLADTDHYVRIRVVQNSASEFLKAEIKIAYPGPRSNPNARYSPAEGLADSEVGAWEAHLALLGFQVERRYEKSRVPFTCTRPYGRFHVELEADHFMSDRGNGFLADRSFVSLSVETDGTQRAEAEEALAKALSDLKTVGIDLVECAGNYEDYFYGHKQLP